MFKFTFFFVALFSGLPLAHAVPENQVAASLRSELIPFFESGKPLNFVGSRGLNIHTYAFEVPGAKRAIVIAPGRSESSLKFAEVLFDLRSLGYSMYIIDHRGQGLSDRELRSAGTPDLGYVEDFDDYVADFTKFMNQIVQPKGYEETYLLAHSMGGAISALYAASHPGAFTKIVFNSPMFAINTAPYPGAIAQALAGTLTAVGQGAKLAPGQKPYPESPFEGNKLTTSRSRFEMAEALVAYKPATAVGGPSNRWVHEGLTATHQIHRLKADQIAVPTLLFQAEADQIVKLKGQDQFCDKMKSCRKISFPGAQHEILNEIDSTRDRAMETITSFFSN